MDYETISAILVGAGLGLLILRMGPWPGRAPHDAARMALDLEAQRLRQASEVSPLPMWHTGPDGKLIWANRVYRQIADVSDTDLPFATRRPSKDGKTRVTLPRTVGDIGVDFEISTMPVTGGTAHIATEISAILKAEAARRTFVQTLSKTFADLPIALAVFDKDRRLALFNPALLDLTGLAPAFLSARPDTMSFFDQLRENRIMPEPKSYAEWRQRLADLIKAARDDRYTETWSLPNDRTYRISGRPHPDGAIAFLIEDISSEISLSRRYRAELDCMSAVLDASDKALAVFSGQGELLLTNAGYRRHWKASGRRGRTGASLADEIAGWRKLAGDSEAWQMIRNSVARTSAAGEARIDAGGKQSLDISVSWTPLPHGATLVSFSGDAQVVAAPQRAQLAHIAGA